jgi:hypothetical protein
MKFRGDSVAAVTILHNEEDNFLLCECCDCTPGDRFGSAGTNTPVFFNMLCWSFLYNLTDILLPSIGMES